MENLILFLNQFFSYFLVVVAFVAAGMLAFFAGRLLKKRSAAKALAEEAEFELDDIEE